MVFQAQFDGLQGCTGSMTARLPTIPKSKAVVQLENIGTKKKAELQ
jgi:hypothetical protein